MPLLNACNFSKSKSLNDLKQEIIKTEKEFETAVKEKGVAKAFYYYADENAVIHRQNDTLIKGNENIKKFYQNKIYQHVILSWTPDFVDVSADGTLGYSYGKYVMRINENNGKPYEFKGVFHTVWKKQGNGTWKYVWD